LEASVKHRGHYYHEFCTEISVDRYDIYPTEDAEEWVTELLRDFMRWIYRQLESEYEFQTSEEQIKETILINEYEFNEDGTLHR
jgi:hypothetical protein